LNPLRILHIVATYYPAMRYGGPVRSVQGLCKALCDLGHDVHVFTTNVDGDTNSDVPLKKPVNLDGVKIWYFPTNWLRRLFWSPEMMIFLKQEIPSFDLVHLHSVFLWPTSAAARVARANGVPYVLSPRGMLDQKLIRKRSRWLKSIWIKMIERRNLARAGCVHLTSEVERHAYENLNLPAGSIEIVPNGIDLDIQYESAAFADLLPTTRPYALFLGRINWKKGADLLVKSWTGVAEWDLVIAGNDEENLRAELEQLTKNLGLADRIHFIGPVDDEDKWGLYHRARAFLLPSISENFANTVLEAMSVACPVLVSPGVGLSDAVVQHGCGLVIQRDEDSISEAILKLQNDEELRLKMGERGREAARKHFSWHVVAQETERVYQSLVQSAESGLSN